MLQVMVERGKGGGLKARCCLADWSYEVCTRRQFDHWLAYKGLVSSPNDADSHSPGT